MAAYYNELDATAAAWLRVLIARGLIADGEVDERSIIDVRPDDLRGFVQCHFFAGIGVWSYSLRRAGYADTRPVWTGSCPCQPFSAAGKGEEFADERHLWPALFRLIRECRPESVFGEQVASKDALAWLDHVCADLEGEGYAVGAVDSCAAGYGAPHIRQRLYWVADANGAESGRGQLGLHAQGRGGDGSAALGECADDFVAHPSQSGREARGTDRVRDAGAVDGASATAHGGEPDAFTFIPGGQSLVMADASDEGRRRLGDEQSEGGGREGRGHAMRGRETGDIFMGDTASGGCGIGGDAALAGSSGHAHGAGILGDTESLGRQRRQDDVNGGRRERALGQAGATNGFWADAVWIPCRDGKARPTGRGISPLVVADAKGRGQRVERDAAQPGSGRHADGGDELMRELNAYYAAKWATEPRAIALADGSAEGMVLGSDRSAPDADNSAEARVQRLRGYGNALAAPQAIEFVKAYLNVSL